VGAGGDHQEVGQDVEAEAAGSADGLIGQGDGSAAGRVNWTA
jgi:hypothetical protein